MALHALLAVVAVCLCITGLFVWMVHPFFIPVALGAVCAVLLHPFERWLHTRCTWMRDYTPATTVFLSSLGLFAPLAGASVLVFNTLSNIASGAVYSADHRHFITMLQHSMQTLQKSLQSVGVHVPAEHWQANAEKWAQQGAQALVVGAGKLAVSTPHFAIAWCVFLATLYFLLRDGVAFSRWLVATAPFSPRHTQHLFTAVRTTVQNAVWASMAASAVQSACVCVGVVMLDVPNPWTLTVLAFVMGFIPLIGNIPVTLGSAWYLFSTDHAWQGVAMLGVAFVVSVSDNVVRPWIQGRGETDHPLLTLLAVFGGVAVWGASGIFLGPVVTTLFVWILRTYSAWKTLSDKQPHAQKKPFS